MASTSKTQYDSSTGMPVTEKRIRIETKWPETIPGEKILEPEQLYKLCSRYINFMWPFACVVTHLPFGRSINQKLLIPELLTSGKYKKFSNELHREWAILHLFDWLNPTYDQPQHIETFHAWLIEAGLTKVETNFGYGGIEGRGVRS